MAIEVPRPSAEPLRTEPQEMAPPVPASGLDVGLLISALLLVFAALSYVLLSFWPVAVATEATAAHATFAGMPIAHIDRETRWLVLVMAAGALGSFIHVATSAGDYIGNRKLVRSWIGWYLLRLPVGASLSLLIYMLLRGGVLTGVQVQIAALDQPFGVIGLSALAGMFAKQASDKLGEVFDTVFKSQKGDQRGDKLGDAVPVLDRVTPNPLSAAGTARARLQLYGKNFHPTSRVRLDDQRRKPMFVSDAELLLELGTGDLEAPRSVQVWIETPGVERGESNRLALEITAPP